MNIIKDSDLAYLLSLGFELELCKQALSENSTLEDATEWILNPSILPVKKPTIEIPKSDTIKVDPQLDFSKPLASSSVLPSSSPNIRDLEKEKEEKRLQKIKFDKIQNELKRDKILEREARKRALLSIKEDKEKRKQKIQPPPTNTVQPKELSKEQPSKGGSEAFIQFKFTNSSIVRQKFSAQTTVNELLDFVKTKEAIHNNQIIDEYLSLISVFPRKVFTRQEGSLDMKTAGFLPNVSLNVNISVPKVISLEPASEPQPDPEVSLPMITSDEDEQMIEAPEDDEMMEINDRLSRSGWERVGTGRLLTDTAPMTEVTSSDTQPEGVQQIRSNVLTALLQRGKESEITKSEETNKLEYHTIPLREICIKAIAVLLTRHTTEASQNLKNLPNLTSDIAESLIDHLVAIGKLNTPTLRKLTDCCYVQKIILDSYSYCTDSLVEVLAKSNSSVSISKVSLRGCDVITDNSIRSISGLKNLCYLDVNNCKLTDKGLKSLENLSFLNYLNLSKTKITDHGIASLVSNSKFKDQLEVLLLDGCKSIKSSNTIIPIINEFTQLIRFSASNTLIGSQNTTLKLKRSIQLRQLDLSHTLITDDDLTKIICRFHSLVELKLGHCEELTTRGLSSLPRDLKYLQLVQFPNREHELDGVLARFKDLPLEHLDLSGFLNITDEGARYIADMKHLRYLNLDGTKITDEGAILLKDLTELERVYLDRTSLTDESISKLTGLSKLDTLSLCHTQVSNVAFKVLGDPERNSFTRYLRTLNLSQCNFISDKGVKYLSSMVNLTNLNLDHTSVSKSCLRHLKELKCLKPVRLQGIIKEEDDDEYSDEDM